ncbi:J domain-containing protein [Micromonospora sp. DT229]|uniref:J domain-containing protein n=1 Tax=Micromonospora sp. DT229 TaxID=3393430 RepID=UPI003CE71AD6
MPSDGQDPYTLLGVTRESSVAEIRQRYLVLVQIWHPDRHQSSPASVREEVNRQMQRINAAYQHLTDTHERAARAGQDRERQERARHERARQAHGHQDQARHDRKRQEREPPDRERLRKERQERERETREREHPRARWTHPRLAGSNPLGTSWATTPTAHPIAITLRSGETGYSLRAYVDEQRTEAAFVGAEGHLLLFRSLASMRQYLARSGGHELADVPGWKDLLDRTTGGAVGPDEDHCYGFDLIQHSLRFSPAQWVPQLFVTTRDVIGEIAEAFSLDDVLRLLAAGSPLDHLDDLLRVVDRPIAGRSARRQLASLPGAQASTVWRRALRGVEERIRWLR